MYNPNCDHQNNECSPEKVRRIELGGGAGIHVCKRHFRTEMEWRKERNKDLTKDCQFDILKWSDLKVVKYLYE